MTMGRRIRQVALALFAITVTLLTAQRAWAERCFNRTTEGRYSVVGDGYLSTGPNTPLVPAKILSIVTADANGNYAGTGTLVIGGQILVQQVFGTQQLNADCTGTITYKQTLGGQPAPDIVFTFVVSDHGNRIDGLSLDPGSVFSAVLRRLD